MPKKWLGITLTGLANAVNQSRYTQYKIFVYIQETVNLFGE